MRPFQFLSPEHQRAAQRAAEIAFGRKDWRYRFAVLDDGRIVASTHEGNWRPINFLVGADHEH
jgi:hypothetical protein